MHLWTSITRFNLKTLQVFTLLCLTWMPQVQTGSAEVYLIDGIYLVVNNQMMTRSEAVDYLESLKNEINRSELSEEKKQQRLKQICIISEIRKMQKDSHLVDFEKCYKMRLLLAIVAVHTAENQPSEVGDAEWRKSAR